MGTRELSANIHKAHFWNLQTKRENSQIEHFVPWRLWKIPRSSEVDHERVLAMLESGVIAKAFPIGCNRHILSIFFLQKRV